MDRVAIPLHRINKLLPLLESMERKLSGARRAVESSDQQELIGYVIEMRVLGDQLAAVFTQGGIMNADDKEMHAAFLRDLNRHVGLAINSILEGHSNADACVDRVALAASAFLTHWEAKKK